MSVNPNNIVERVFEKNELWMIPKKEEYDEIQPYSLLIDTGNSINAEELYTMCQTVSLEISMHPDNRVIYLIPLSFCLSYFDKESTSSILFIPFDWLGDYLPLYAMHYMQLKCVLTPSNPFQSCKMIFKGRNNSIVKELYNISLCLEQVSHHLSTYNIQPHQPIYKTVHTSLYGYSLRGIFIETNDIENIRSITVERNNVYSMSSHSCNKINNKLLYISIDNKDYKDQYFYYAKDDISLQVECYNPFHYMRIYGLHCIVRRLIHHTLGYSNIECNSLIHLDESKCCL